MIENNETLIADLLSYADAFQGRSGTSGYAIAAKNAALAIRNLEARLKDVETHLSVGSPHDALLVIRETRPSTEFERFVTAPPGEGT